MSQTMTSGRHLPAISTAAAPEWAIRISSASPSSTQVIDSAASKLSSTTSARPTCTPAQGGRPRYPLDRTLTDTLDYWRRAELAPRGENQRMKVTLTSGALAVWLAGAG